MKIYLFLVAFFLGFILNHSFAQVNKSKDQKTITTKTNTSNKITCIFCKGTGKGDGIPLTCMNCISWSAEYKKKIPCHVCKDTRIVYEKKCPMCDGTGKLDKNWYKMGMDDVTYDSTIKMALGSKGKIPVTDKPMTDDQAWKMFNEYANPALKQNGHGEVYQTVVSQYSMRPKERESQYVETYDGAKYKEVETKQKEEVVKQKKEHYENNVGILKSFFGEDCNFCSYNPYEGDYGRIIVTLPWTQGIILDHFEIDGDILLNRKADSDDRSTWIDLYNRKGKLLYSGSGMSFKVLSYKENNDTNVSYVYLYGTDDRAQIYNYTEMIANSDGELLAFTKDGISGASYKENKLFVILSPNELLDFNSYVSTNKDFRYFALRVSPNNITSLGNITYQYKIFDLKSGTQVKQVSESNLKSYLKKLFTNNSTKALDASRTEKDKENGLINGFRESIHIATN